MEALEFMMREHQSRLNPSVVQGTHMIKSTLGLGIMCNLLLSSAFGAPLKADQTSTHQTTSNQKQSTEIKAEIKEEVDRSHWKAGVMIIQSDLETGSVEMGGKKISGYPLPGPWTLSPGRYTLTLRDEGWSQTRVFNVEPGKVHKIKIYRDPANDPDAEVVPSDFEIVPDQVKRDLYHPGAGFSLKSTGYILLGISAASLAYGLYEQVSSAGAKVDAQNIPSSKADQRKKELDSAMAGSWRAKYALGFGGISLLSGVAFSLFASGGWLDSKRLKSKVKKVDDDEFALLKPKPQWGVSLSGEGSSVWAHWKW